MTKCYALQKDVFDINKVTVVGSPTITDDGVASGLQANNYLYTPSFNLAELTEIEFDYDITTKEQTGTVYLCGLKDTALSLYISSTGYMQTRCGHTYSTAIIPSTAYNVGKLHFRFVINPISLKAFVYVFQDGNKIGEIDIAISSGILTTRRFIFGADYSGNYGYALNGSIDLKSIKVRQEGTVYSPTKPTYYLERRKEGFDLSKFTVVGSPTITEDGIASGFSSSNYLTANHSFNPLAKPWKIEMSFKTSNDLTISQQAFIIMNSAGTSSSMRLYANNLRLVAGTTSWGADIFNWNGATVVQANTDYNLEIEFTGTKYIYTVNGVVVATTDSTSSIFNIDNNIIYIGNAKTTDFMLGSINLKQFSITVDGKEVFTGAKEKYYAMKGNM